MAAAQHGAVALLLPMNVQFGLIAFDGPATAPPPPAAPARKPARKAAVQAAAALLQQSRKPLIVAGRGAHLAGARDALIRLAEKLGAGLATTLKAKDMFRGHPFDVGMVGSFSHAGGRRLIDQADCIVAFGAALNQNTTSYGKSLPADVPLIQVDSVRSNIGRWFHADVAVVADARQAAEQLLELLPERAAEEKPLHGDEMRRWLAGFELANDFRPEHTPRTMDPRALALELDRLLPQERNVVYDAGNFLQVVPYVSVPGPDRIKMAADFASIGMGFGTALGYACGTPERVTVLFLGDGSFLMTLGELETVVREDIPLVIVLMNDCAYGAELHYLKMREMPVTKSVFPDIDYAPVAEAFFFQTATVRTLDELRALAPMLRKPERPILLDCKINASIAAPFLLESVEHERRSAS
jgi:thiamine pyrophosphate-dependent acetolactate synthase large subunit-like protein